MNAVMLEPGRLSLGTLRAVGQAPIPVGIEEGARPRVDAAARAIGGVLAEDRVVYGVNTGFGSLARTRIDASKLAEPQPAALLSPAAGPGPLPDDALLRLV